VGFLALDKCTSSYAVKPRIIEDASRAAAR
jgi:hypothetical protein